MAPVTITRLVLRGPIALAVTLAAIVFPGCAPDPATPSSADIPRSLLREARPIGTSADFQPPATGPVLRPCSHSLGPRQDVHVEVFAANRVVLVPAGIGTGPPQTKVNARVTWARCYGLLVTLGPTGLILVRGDSHLTLGSLFRSWGEPLSSRQIASFRARPGNAVRAFVDGRPWNGSPGAVPLVEHAEIVVEVGPFVPPHSSYTFPAET